MKRSERAPWVALTESGYILCNWCRYTNWGDEECYCGHPFALRLGLRYSPRGIEPGDDCVGFWHKRGDTPAAAQERIAANKGEREGE